MMLQNQNIYTRAQLHRYFTIEEQYGSNILKKTPAFERFVNRLLDTEPCKTDSSVRSNLNPGPYFSAEWFRESLIDPESFEASINKHAGIYPKFYEKNKKKIDDLLSRKSFTAVQAGLLWLFILLHIQAMHDITDDGQAYMIQALDKKSAPRFVSVDSSSAPKSLPMSSQWLGCLTRTTYTCSDFIPCVISLAETTQRRTLFLDESLTCFESGGTSLFFLPRTIDPQDSKACDDYCLAMQNAYRGASGSQKDRISKPILDVQLRCAGYLLKDGSVMLGDKKPPASEPNAVLDAAADDRFIYLATEHGVDCIRRSDSTRMPWIETKSAVEEISVRGGESPAVIYRHDNYSDPIIREVPADLANSQKSNPKEG